MLTVRKQDLFKERWSLSCHWGWKFSIRQHSAVMAKYSEIHDWQKLWQSAELEKTLDNSPVVRAAAFSRHNIYQWKKNGLWFKTSSQDVSASVVSDSQNNMLSNSKEHRSTTAALIWFLQNESSIQFTYQVSVSKEQQPCSLYSLISHKRTFSMVNVAVLFVGELLCYSARLTEFRTLTVQLRFFDSQEGFDHHFNHTVPVYMWNSTWRNKTIFHQNQDNTEHWSTKMELRLQVDPYGFFYGWCQSLEIRVAECW